MKPKKNQYQQMQAFDNMQGISLSLAPTRTRSKAKAHKCRQWGCSQ